MILEVLVDEWEKNLRDDNKFTDRSLITAAHGVMCRPYFGEKLDFLLMRGSVCFAAGCHGL